MERKKFLKGLGIIGVGALIPLRKATAATQNMADGLMDGNKLQSGSCILIPQETAGPYPFNLSGNSAMFRQDITEGQPGIPLNLALTIVNTNDSCAPVPNARIDIWHCDKDGYYSEFSNSGYLGNQNNVGNTFFRGIQMTDVNGVAQFITIYPGWYGGRAVHIHFQVFLNSVLSATSQAAFPDSLNTTVNGTTLYSPHGQNPTTNAVDNVFSDMANTQYEMLTVVPNTTTGGYDASLTIGIAIPLTGVVNLEPETGGQFKLSTNYPNPFTKSTTIPFILTNPSQVKIDLFDMSGKNVFELLSQKMNAGKQAVIFDNDADGAKLPAGNYLYQLSVENTNGIYHQCKVLSIK